MLSSLQPIIHNLRVWVGASLSLSCYCCSDLFAMILGVRMIRHISLAYLNSMLGPFEAMINAVWLMGWIFLVRDELQDSLTLSCCSSDAAINRRKWWALPDHLFQLAMTLLSLQPIIHSREFELEHFWPSLAIAPQICLLRYWNKDDMATFFGLFELSARSLLGRILWSFFMLSLAMMMSEPKPHIQSFYWELSWRISDPLMPSLSFLQLTGVRMICQSYFGLSELILDAAPYASLDFIPLYGWFWDSYYFHSLSNLLFELRFEWDGSCFLRFWVGSCRAHWVLLIYLEFWADLVDD